MFPEFSLSERYQEIYPDVGFGLALISSCRETASPEGLRPTRKKMDARAECASPMQSLHECPATF